MEYKLLENYNESLYLLSHDNCNIDDYDNISNYNRLSNSAEFEFVSVLEKNSEIKKQFGFSKKEQCSWAFVVLVCASYGDGVFLSNNVKTTYLTEKDGVVKDVNDDFECYGELTKNIKKLYHPLPDGKLLEIDVKNYKKNMAKIFNFISSFREKCFSETINDFHQNKKLKI